MNNDLNSKLVYGLERLSEVFKSLLWEKAKRHGLSPIQIQLLSFVSSHRKELNTVSLLAKEFNLTKPTISDAIKALCSKGLLAKDYTGADHRRFTLFVTDKGKGLLEELNNYAEPLGQELFKLDEGDLLSTYRSVMKLITGLHQKGVLEVQRHCFSCRFFEHSAGRRYCQFLEQSLSTQDLRLDCPEHQAKA